MWRFPKWKRARRYVDMTNKMVWDLKDVKRFFSKIVIKVNLFRK